MYASQTLLCQSSKQILPHSHVKKFCFFFWQIFQDPFFETKASVFPQKVHSKAGLGLHCLVSQRDAEAACQAVWPPEGEVTSRKADERLKKII